MTFEFPLSFFFSPSIWSDFLLNPQRVGDSWPQDTNWIPSRVRFAPPGLSADLCVTVSFQGIFVVIWCVTSLQLLFIPSGSLLGVRPHYLLGCLNSIYVEEPHKWQRLPSPVYFLCPKIMVNSIGTSFFLSVFHTFSLRVGLWVHCGFPDQNCSSSVWAPSSPTVNVPCLSLFWNLCPFSSVL